MEDGDSEKYASSMIQDFVFFESEKAGFPQALEIMVKPGKSLKKVPCMEKSLNLKKPE